MSTAQEQSGQTGTPVNPWLEFPQRAPLHSPTEAQAHGKEPPVVLRAQRRESLNYRSTENKVFKKWKISDWV